MIAFKNNNVRFVGCFPLKPFGKKDHCNLNNLPQNKSTIKFSSNDASGSTSQAASTCESLEIGTNLLLIDEDTCATNFMIRDNKMASLVESDKEPITPFISKIRSLYNNFNVSTIMVVGSSGQYFQVANSVIMMDNYIPKNVTQKAQSILSNVIVKAEHKTNDNNNNNNTKNKNDDFINEYNEFGDISCRYVDPYSILPDNKKIKIKHKFQIQFGDTLLDLNAITQIVEQGQARAIADALSTLKDHILKDCNNNKNGKCLNVKEMLTLLENAINSNTLDTLRPYKSGRLVRPRSQEIGAALNRLRTLECFTNVDYDMKQSFKNEFKLHNNNNDQDIAMESH